MVLTKNPYRKSKHLKGQLHPPVGNKKCVFVTKNDHFLKGPVFVM